jgi:hypothetical protein
MLVSDVSINKTLFLMCYLHRKISYNISFV